MFHIILNVIWNPITCACENGEYLGSIVSDTSYI